MKDLDNFPSFSVSPRLRGENYLLPTNLLSSTTSISAGHSFQLCRQHTIMSHPFGSWPCRRKFLLSYSNSIRRYCHFPGATWRLATQSGNFPCTDSTCKPSPAATIPNSTITPSSFTGAFVIGDRSNGSPITGLSLRTPRSVSALPFSLCDPSCPLWLSS